MEPGPRWYQKKSPGNIAELPLMANQKKVEQSKTEQHGAEEHQRLTPITGLCGRTQVNTGDL